VAAGDGPSAARERARITRLMEQTFGPDWRKKVVVGPTGVFHLRDVFVESGLESPIPFEDRPRGLFQMMPPPQTLGPPSRRYGLTSAAQVRAALARARYRPR
jgi:hypothetical protein